jgi:hypothetical protein
VCDGYVDGCPVRLRAHQLIDEKIVTPSQIPSRHCTEDQQQGSVEALGRDSDSARGVESPSAFIPA